MTPLPSYATQEKPWAKPAPWNGQSPAAGQVRNDWLEAAQKSSGPQGQQADHKASVSLGSKEAPTTSLAYKQGSRQNFHWGNLPRRYQPVCCSQPKCLMYRTDTVLKQDPWRPLRWSGAVAWSVQPREEQHWSERLTGIHRYLMGW